MTVRHQLIRKPPAEAWSVLSDGALCACRVVGSDESWNRDGRWPDEGTEIGYARRFGPLEDQDRTVARAYEPGRRLELEPMAGRSGSARIAITVEPWGPDTLVIVDEHPLRGPAGRWHHAVLDVALQPRHRAMPAELVESKTETDPSADAAAEASGASGRRRSGPETGGPRVGA
ncbi:polyketide cyclase [Streptomyces sp. NE5-10]|uniref:SRPBCC family protein n=1 Tax=Streptomyces sp. NE5-10 TaxID=2759674 RepID=UPI0019070FC6|nr:SRPBCC family protein [Streptomyces sp. NE5-10]GHJ98116.1 polyketide cyclase [Streptomyces sp. NE5-10]